MSDHLKYPSIFSTFKIGELDVANRLIGAAMVTNLADAEGDVTDRQIDHYISRAAGGVGMVTVEMTAIHPRGRAWYYMLGLWDDRFIPGLKRLSDALHDAGTMCSIQLGHAGRQTSRSIIGTRPVAPSELSQFPADHPNFLLPRTLSLSEIEDIIEQSCLAAQRARMAGFDAIEIHAAHGYLFHQFLSPSGNIREDEFGGDTTRRCRLVTRIIESIKAKCPQEFAIICKIDGDEHVPGGIDVAEATKISRLLAEAGADSILVSAGCGASLEYLIPPAYMPSIPNLSAAKTVKSNLDIPVGVVGKVDDFSIAEAALAKGEIDYFALARPLLADADLPNKLKRGTDTEIRRCIYCNEKCNGIDRQYEIGCSVNPRVGRESLVLKRRRPMAEGADRIVVIGGGPAGLEAALAAAERGCQVHLFEANKSLGGQVNLVARIPGKETWSYIVPYYESMLGKKNVRIYCEQAPTFEDIREIAPKAVILATGAAPDPGEIELTENTCAVDAFAALAEPEAVGDEVAIIGAQRLAVDTALFLSSQGKRVTILCRGQEEDYLLSGLTPSMRAYVLEKLSHENVNVNYGASCCSIDQECLSIQQDGDTCEMVFETVVLAASMKPALPDCVKDISQLDASVYRVGDCLFPRGIGSAVLEGFEAGRLT